MELQNGLRVLLQERPAARNDIFQVWNINCQAQRKLEKLRKQINDYSIITQDQPFNQNFNHSNHQNKQQFLDGHGNKAYLNVSPPGDFTNSRVNKPSNWLQPTDIRTPIPINSSQFNSTLNYSGHHINNSYHESSVGNSRNKEVHVQNTYIPPQHNQPQNQFQNSNQFTNLYHTKSTSNLQQNNKTQMLSSSRGYSPRQ